MECLECFSPVCLLTRQIDEFSELREMKGKIFFPFLTFIYILSLYVVVVRDVCYVLEMCMQRINSK